MVSAEMGTLKAAKYALSPDWSIADCAAWKWRSVCIIVLKTFFIWDVLSCARAKYTLPSPICIENCVVRAISPCIVPISAWLKL